MNTVHVLISCAVNHGWTLQQLDVKNAFLHVELDEEVYMDIPPGLSNDQTIGKVCRLRRSLYGLKQSPRAWFGRFSKAIRTQGYKQNNAEHFVYLKEWTTFHFSHCICG